MPTEGATHIDDLDPAKPDGATEQGNLTDDYIRELKAVIQRDLPAITGPITASQSELNYLDGAIPGTGVASTAVVLDGNLDFNFGVGDVSATDITASGDVNLSKASPEISMALISSVYQYLLQANATHFHIRGANYYDGDDKYSRTGDGAVKFVVSTGSQSGRVLVQTVVQGTAGDVITWTGSVSSGPGIDIDADNAKPLMYEVGVGWDNIASEGYVDDKISSGGTPGAAITYAKVQGTAFTQGDHTDTIAHGLGGAPQFVRVALKCTSADGGYSANDEVEILAGVLAPGTSNSNYVSARVTSTQVIIRMEATGGTVFNLPHATSGSGIFAPDSAKWEWVAYCMRIA